MAEGKQRHDWALVCELVATIRNVNGGDNGRPVKGTDLNPFAKKPKRTKEQEAALLAQEIEMAKALFRGTSVIVRPRESDRH